MQQPTRRTAHALAAVSAPALAQNTLVQVFTASLSSAGESPDNMGLFSPGTGTGTFDLFRNATTGVYSLDYTVTVQNLVYPENTALPDPVMMAHFHDHYLYTTLPNGTTSVSPYLPNGPVVKGVYDASITGEPPLTGATPLTFSGVWSSADAEEPLSPVLLSDLEAGNLYYNVHTMDYPNGAIRGEILPAAAPEPSQTAALGLGFLGLSTLALKARRRTRRA